MDNFMTMYRQRITLHNDTAIIRRYVSKHARTRQNEVVKENDNVAATNSQKSRQQFHHELYTTHDEIMRVNLKYFGVVCLSRNVRIL